MPIWRLQTLIAADSLDPSDRMVMTPHFNDQGVGTDPQGLCDDWADAIHTWMGAGNTTEIIVRAYDAQGTKPVYPQGEAVRNQGTFKQCAMPREVALCLSFYSEHNRPRTRGRLYMPAVVLGTSASRRPTQSQMDKGKELAQFAENLGGVDVDWSIYSRMDNKALKVTDYWINDEWDTVRSRGWGETRRDKYTTSE